MMAKKKVEKESPFVPVEEQPYQVPENWCWTYLGDIAQWGSGGTPSRKHKEYYNGNIPWIKTGELNNKIIFDSEEKITQLGLVNSSAKLFPIKTVAIAMYGATIGKTGILGIEAATNQACACGVCTPVLNYMYLFYYAQSQQDTFIRKGKGGAQPNISQAIITSHEIPLPPLAEQQRIVDRIESLFAKLDEAKEKAQEALESFETRKAAILNEAFDGSLTSWWRGKYPDISARPYLDKVKESGNGISRQEFDFWDNTELPDTWCESKIGKLLYFAGRIGWKGLKAEEYTEEGPLLLSVYNLNDGDEVTFHRVYHITKERYEESPEIMVQVGDVLLTKDGAGIGKLGYVSRLPQEVTINSSLLLIRPGEAALSKFVYYLLLSPKLQDIVKERITGSATPHLFQKDIREFVIPVPPMEEQMEIVMILDHFFEREKRAKNQVESTLEAIDTMKKSILSKAFRGELGTNNPEDESAEELLKRTLT